MSLSVFLYDLKTLTPYSIGAIIWIGDNMIRTFIQTYEFSRQKTLGGGFDE